MECVGDGWISDIRLLWLLVVLIKASFHSPMTNLNPYGGQRCKDEHSWIVYFWLKFFLIVAKGVKTNIPECCKVLFSPLTTIIIFFFLILSYDWYRVAEVVRGHGGPPPKSLDSKENFKPEHTLFCSALRFVAIYALFGDLCVKQVPFWAKNSVLWARNALLHGIYCLFHWVKFANLRLRAKTMHLSRKL